MAEEQAGLRVGIAVSVEERVLRHLPAGVEVVRYEPEDDAPLSVDMLVAPSYGKDAARVLQRAKTRYVQTISAGVETVQPYVGEGVVLCNARGVHDAATAEWTVAAILASLKWLPLYDEMRRKAHWTTRAETDAYWEQTYGAPHTGAMPVTVEDLAEKTVMIVGYGAIGKAIEARLLPFEPGRIVKVAHSAREGVEPVAALDTLLPEADVVVLILPLTPETEGLIGEKQLGRMKRGALLVNAARGAVVDTDALVAALESRKIRAALDVTDPEPLPDGHALWSAPGLLLTPHVAGSSPLVADRIFKFVGRQLQHLLDGEEPENVIRGVY